VGGVIAVAWVRVFEAAMETLAGQFISASFREAARAAGMVLQLDQLCLTRVRSSGRPHSRGVIIAQMSALSALKVSAGRRPALLAALLAAVALVGCGRSEPPGPPTPSTTLASTASVRLQPGRVSLGDGSTYAAVATTDVTARSKPGGGRVVGLFPEKTPWGSPTPFLVKEAFRDAAGDIWFKVLLPRRPNESTGWIRRDQVRLRSVAERLEVDLSARTVRLLRNGRTEGTWRVGIGRDATPTPIGSFYLTVKLRPPQISTVYGAWALGLSAYSEVLEQFGTGDGQIALHGTSDPTDLGRQVSNGCVRLDNTAITSLAETLPLGTPVTIRA
jgi:lipoprotein-anchoring transpeptidase ErfK/SrfK